MLGSAGDRDSMSKQKTWSESLVSLEMPPRSRIFEEEILQVANLLRGIVILTSNRVIFLSETSYLSIEFKVPSSLL